MKATTMFSRFVALAIGGVALVAVSGHAYAGRCVSNGLAASNGLRSETALSACGIDPSQSLSASFAAQTK